MDIFVANRCRRLIIAPEVLRRLARDVLTCAMAELELPPSQVSVMFLGDPAMRRLNRHYRKLDKSTDVLSFAQSEGGDFPLPPGVPKPLGDVVISVETAERQASAARHSLEKEIAILLIHGLLHLAGYDDEETESRRRMLSTQNRLLKHLEKDGSIFPAAPKSRRKKSKP